MKQRFYIPKSGVLIRNHDGRGHLPPEGAVRMQNQYYDRRVKDGDLSVRDVESIKPEAAVETAAPVRNKPGRKGDSE